MSKYEIGDIVWVREFDIKEQEKVNYHSFVIIDDDEKVVPVDYFGFVVSSNIQKSKEHSKFKYNEPIQKNSNNRLRTDSIVKCDQIFELPKKCIEYRIGHVDAEDLLRFLDAYKNYLEEDYQ